MLPNIQRLLTVTARAVCVTVVAFFSSPANAAEVHVLAAAAMQSVFKDIRDDFQAVSGYRLIIHYGTIGAVNEWAIAGEEADLIIGSSESMPALVAAGKVNRNSLVVLCKTGIGIVSAKGLDVSVRSVEDFKRVLLNAKAIVYADPSRGGAAGIHVAKVIEQLGLTDQIKPKVRLAAGGDITEVTLSLGPTALGMTQISEIADKPQAELVGRLPKELQNYTEFMAGVTINTTQLAGANALLRFFKTHKVSAVIRAKGMEGFASSGGSE